MDGELTTGQVADYLGVKVQTVYAYVSRGVLAPVRREPGTGSLFALADVRGLVRGGRAGRRGGPAASDDVRTQVTEVTGGHLAYRGHDVEDLAGTWSFEQVRELLVGVPGDASWPGPGERESLAALTAALPERTGVMDRFKHAVLVAGATDVGRHDRSPGAFARAGTRSAAFMALSLPGAEPAPAGRPTLAGTLTTYLDRCPTELLDAALVLLADHDLAVSTTAVRVAVSSGADPYSALLAGLAAADSPLHLTASLQVLDWLSGAVRDPQGAIDAALAGRRPPGFGHVVYTEQDPRAQLLLERLEPACDRDELAALRTIEAELLERRGWVLNIDVGLALLVRVLGLPRDAGPVIFACARTAGWTAHAVEELREPGMRFRLRGVYNGPRRG
ncbi:citrate/2-methylcitrate synthase [Ornithinimicrobium pratense]|uniref:citrate synthase (unknown stereospecificity) n=1 Tax=Ornithinimicrobium pratense TaxID=2593973 RepID=A0A5J6V206_9MICO|nr:citrate/2-methylcitrate synthase [Ornithinimicrobium pratense]QFG67900.1 helix-turn-helix domain-containing protein [Ornithinimicrobium pratense]